MIEIGSNILERYEVVKLLGRGGFGTIWKVKELATDDIYVLKTIKMSTFMNIGYSYDVLIELNILLGINHENILHAREAKRVKDMIYIILPFSKKGDVFHVLVSNRLNSLQLKKILYQIFCGLNYLHSHNIIHGDVKSENVLIFKGIETKIADFGLSEVYYPGKKMSVYKYSPRYMPPEIMFRDLTQNLKEYDTSADIWATGCILYELIFGESFFNGENNEEIQISMYEKLEKNIDTEEIFSHLIDCEEYQLYSKCSHYDLDKLKLDAHIVRHFNEYIAENILSLLQSCLMYNPDSRITAFQALQHPFFRQDIIDRKGNLIKKGPYIYPCINVDPPLLFIGNDPCRIYLEYFINIYKGLYIEAIDIVKLAYNLATLIYPFPKDYDSIYYIIVCFMIAMKVLMSTEYRYREQLQELTDRIFSTPPSDDDIKIFQEIENYIVHTLGFNIIINTDLDEKIERLIKD